MKLGLKKCFAAGGHPVRTAHTKSGCGSFRFPSPGSVGVSAYLCATPRSVVLATSARATKSNDRSPATSSPISSTRVTPSAATSWAHRLLPTRTMSILTAVPVAVALGTNAAVWSACAVILFKESLAYGTAALLVAGGFEQLAFVALAPHIIGALAGASVCIAVWLDGALASFVPVALIGVAALIGTVSAKPRTSYAAHSIGTIYGVSMSVAVLAALPAVTLDAQKYRRLLPCADGALGIASTSLVVYVASGGAPAAALPGIAITGGLVALNARLSLTLNPVKEHTIIGYAIWNTGLLVLDNLGHYAIGTVPAILQTLCMAAAIFLILRPSLHPAPFY